MIEESIVLEIFILVRKQVFYSLAMFSMFVIHFPDIEHKLILQK